MHRCFFDKRFGVSETFKAPLTNSLKKIKQKLQRRIRDPRLQLPATTTLKSEKRKGVLKKGKDRRVAYSWRGGVTIKDASNEGESLIIREPRTGAWGGRDYCNLSSSLNEKTCCSLASPVFEYHRTKKKLRAR